MNTHADSIQQDKSQLVATAQSQKQSVDNTTFQCEDNRPEAIAQRKLQKMASLSPQAMYTAQLQEIVGNHTSPLQSPIQKNENNTGLPHNLKTGMENLSGMSLDDVIVHRNSDKPAQLQAHAYAQGADIHLGPGQEKHLPHEAWHVVQQKQGRVKPTVSLNEQVKINDDTTLETEADVMGLKALQLARNSPRTVPAQTSEFVGVNAQATQLQVIQRVDTVLGAGSLGIITAGMNVNSPYTDNNYLRGLANGLLGAGLSHIQTRLLMRDMGNVIVRQGKYTRCAQTATAMANNNVPYDLISPLIINHIINLPAADHARITNLATHLRNWSYGNVNALIGGANPNGFNLTERGSIARRVPQNAFAQALVYIGIAGWNAASIEHVATGRAAGNPNNLRANYWATIATNVGVNRHATTIAFARINGWDARGIPQLATGYNAGNQGMNRVQWVMLAEATGTNEHLATIAFAALAGRGAVGKAAIATRFETDNFGLGYAQWVALANANQGRNAAAVGRIAEFVGGGWPASIAFNGGNAAIFTTADGVGWGAGNPHVTIHNVEADGRIGWEGHPEYHVRIANGGANVYDFVGDVESFFDNVNTAPARLLVVGALALQFRQAMGI